MTRNLWEYHWWISVCKRCFTLWKSELGKQRSGKNTTIFSVLPRLLFTKYIFQSLPLRQIDWKESNLRADYTIRSFVFHILHTLIDRVALKRADWFDFYLIVFILCLCMGNPHNIEMNLVQFVVFLSGCPWIDSVLVQKLYVLSVLLRGLQGLI